MPKMIVLLDGIEFVGEETSENDAKGAADILHEHINRLDKLMMPLRDGSYLLLNQEQMKRAILRVVP